MTWQVFDTNGALKTSVPTVAASAITGLVALANGGTHADLSATGAGVLQQAAVGADVSVQATTGSGNVVRTTAPTIASPVINTGVSGSAIDDDATFSSPSSSKVPTSNAVKGYVDQTVLGLAAKADARLATAAALPSNTYSNGASGVGATLTAVATGTLTVDGVTVALNDRIIVKNEVTDSHNGLYKCTIAGAIGVAYVLTRTTDGDTDAELRGSWLFSTEGTANAGQGWLNTNTSAITFGSTSITYGEFSAGAIAAGTGLSKSGNTISLQTPVTAANGGTGQDFSGSTGAILVAAGVMSAQATTGTGNVVRASSPTITTPTVADLTNMTHSHQNAAGGGTLDAAAIAAGTLAVARGGTNIGSYAAKGDLLASSGITTLSKLAVGTDFRTLRADSSQSTGLAYGPDGGDYIVLEDQRSSGTAGGTATSGSFQTRTLNTEVLDNANLCSLSSNQFTLTAGTYELFATATFFKTNSIQIRIQNTTDATTLLLGPNTQAVAASGIQNTAHVAGIFTVAASKALELQSRVQTTEATDGMGAAASFGTEVYAQIVLRRISG